MKKIVLICLAAILGLGVANAGAETKKKAAETVTTVFAADIDCEKCAKKIEANIPFEKGVKEVSIDLPAKTVTVTYDPKKNTDEGIVKGFANIKVRAEVRARADEKR